MRVDFAALESELSWDDSGRVRTIVQELATGRVVAHRLLARQELRSWCEGRGGDFEASWGRLVAACPGPDATLLLRVQRPGSSVATERATREGGASCQLELGWLARTVDSRRQAGPEESYSARLLAAGAGRICRKVAEEAGETIVAAMRADLGADRERRELVAESADLLYHLVVLWRALDVSAEEIAIELSRRHRPQSAGDEAGSRSADRGGRRRG